MSKLGNNTIELTGMVINVMPVGEYDNKGKGQDICFCKRGKKAG